MLDRFLLNILIYKLLDCSNIDIIISKFQGMLNLQKNYL